MGILKKLKTSASFTINFLRPLSVLPRVSLIKITEAYSVQYEAKSIKGKFRTMNNEEQMTSRYNAYN